MHFRYHFALEGKTDSETYCRWYLTRPFKILTGQAGIIKPRIFRSLGGQEAKLGERHHLLVSLCAYLHERCYQTPHVQMGLLYLRASDAMSSCPPFSLSDKSFFVVALRIIIAGTPLDQRNHSKQLLKLALS